MNNRLKNINCVHILLLSVILYEVAYLIFGWLGVLAVLSLAIPVSISFYKDQIK